MMYPLVELLCITVIDHLQQIEIQFLIAFVRESNVLKPII